MSTKIIVTPINLISNKKNLTFNGKKARVDYLLELENFSKESKWDDSRYNNAVIGNMFGFVHQIEDKIEMFEITNILPANTRPDYWDLPKHRHRNVLILSPKIEEIKWSEFKTQNNLSLNYKLLGTTRLKYTGKKIEKKI